jgi:hypothetical protein
MDRDECRQLSYDDDIVFAANASKTRAECTRAAPELTAIATPSAMTLDLAQPLGSTSDHDPR